MRVRIRRFGERQGTKRALALEPLVVVRAGNDLALWQDPSGFTAFAPPAVSPSGESGLLCSFHELSTPGTFTVRPFPVDTCDLAGVGSEEAPRRAGLRPPLKPSVRISRTGLSQRYAVSAAHGSVRHGQPTRLLNGFSSHVSSDIDFWVFHKRNLSMSVSLLACQLLPLNYLCPPPSPAHVAAFMRSHRFHGASGTIRRSDYSPGFASHFAPRL